MWQLLLAQEEGEEAGGKNLKICWEFFVFKNVLSLCITELGKRDKKKKMPVCYLSWRNSLHIFVLLFPEAFPCLMLTVAYTEPEILRKEKEKPAAELFFLKPSHMTISVSEVLSEGSVFQSHQWRWRSWHCTNRVRDDSCHKGLTLQIEMTEEE